MNVALWAVRILRRLPHTRNFDSHLTDCAALAVIYHPFNDCEPLTLAHVFKRRPLPDFRGLEAERFYTARARRSQIHVLH